MLSPTAPAEREALLDALRGFAVLGILLINIEVMRGPDWLVLMGGYSTEPDDLSDAIVQFAVGWLGTAKFISSLAILFGVGAALIAGRALRTGQAPHRLLAGRYFWLVVFGAAHMLIFPGDILFLYGVTGFTLLAFVTLPVRALLVSSATILVVFTAAALIYTGSLEASASTYQDVPGAYGDFGVAAYELRDRASEAFSRGSLADIIGVQAAVSLLLQPGQLLILPWTLALFLFGYAIARAGLVIGLGERRALLRRGAWIGLAAGLPANFGIGFSGTLAGFGARPQLDPPWLTLWADLGQMVGAPLLAVGYLCALALLFAARGTPYAFVAVGRMTLTAYLLQSVLALTVFGGLRLYDRFSSTSALIVVAAIWALLLWLCPLWLRQFRIGPAEWLWRSLTYGRRQPLRRAA